MQSLAQQLFGNKRVVLGQDDFNSGQDFFGDDSTCGPYVIILPFSKVTNFDGQKRMYNFEVTARLYWGFPADRPYDFLEADDAWSSLIDAWAAEANWSNTGASAPEDVTTDAQPQVYSSHKPQVAMYEMTLSFLKGIGC